MRIVSERLHNQRLASGGCKQAVDVVRWLGAVQAQDFPAAKWALGLRMQTATDAAIEKAYNDGQILRTHLMRPTWHFVAPDDIRWLLALTAPRVNARAGPNYRKYELDAAVFKKTNKVLTKALRDGKHLTRAELRAALNRSGIAADDLIRLVHIMLRAELDGVVCSGRRLGKQFTYALLEERVAPAQTLTRDEALAKLTARYFTSHGPATLPDFVWWSGLTASDARRGVEMIDSHLKHELLDDKTYWLPRSKPRPVSGSTHLLPAFDEYNVAYKDRAAVVDFNDTHPQLSAWDLLGPTVIVDGKVAGNWKAALTQKAVTVTVTPARDLKRPEKLAITKAAERYAAFLGLPLHVHI
jgi:winged helix DNA-binding protein